VVGIGIPRRFSIANAAPVTRGPAETMYTRVQFETLGPFEVESALVEHAAVAEAAVVGKPDPQRGQIVKAFVVLAPGRSGSAALAVELQDHCKRVSAPYKYPREIEFVTDLPKTISGKIRRVELREREITLRDSADSS